MNYRHEIKFIINSNQAEMLKIKLRLLMTPDANSVDGSYRITSLYFDDLSSSAYYEKLNGVLFRKKYRIRLYDNNTSFIRLECKYKDDNMTRKKQVKVSMDQAIDLINKNEFESKNDLIKQFFDDVRLKSLMPSVIVDYNRYALTYPISDVRITFDSHIKSGNFNNNLFDFDNVHTAVIDDDILVLEVKYNEILPEAIAIILSTVPMFRQAYSKFAICRSIK